MGVLIARALKGPLNFFETPTSLHLPLVYASTELLGRRLALHDMDSTAAMAAMNPSTSI